MDAEGVCICDIEVAGHTSRRCVGHHHCHVDNNQPVALECVYGCNIEVVAKRCFVWCIKEALCWKELWWHLQSKQTTWAPKDCQFFYKKYFLASRCVCNKVGRCIQIAHHLSLHHWKELWWHVPRTSFQLSVKVQVSSISFLPQFFLGFLDTKKVLVFDITADVSGQLQDAASKQARNFKKEKVSLINNFIYYDVCQVWFFISLENSHQKLFLILLMMLLDNFVMLLPHQQEISIKRKFHQSRILSTMMCVQVCLLQHFENQSSNVCFLYYS